MDIEEVQALVDQTFSTEPADRERAEFAINTMYDLARLNRPSRFVWFGSPTILQNTAVALKRWHHSRKLGGLPNHLTDSQLNLLSQIEFVRDRAFSAVTAIIAERTFSGIIDLETYYDPYEREPISRLMRQNVDRASHILRLLNYEVYNSYYTDECVSGQFSLNKIFNFRRAANHLPFTQSMYDIFSSCGPWAAFEGTCLVSERLSGLHYDSQKRLHNDDGPAISYPDGVGVWCLNGVVVPKGVVEDPSILTVADVVDERNAEVRRLMINKLGYEKFLKLIDATSINIDSVHGTLWASNHIIGGKAYSAIEFHNPYPESDGTHKRYWYRVPPHYKTAKGARAWVMGVRKTDLNQILAES